MIVFWKQFFCLEPPVALPYLRVGKLELVLLKHLTSYITTGRNGDIALVRPLDTENAAPVPRSDFLPIGPKCNF